MRLSPPRSFWRVPRSWQRAVAPRPDSGTTDGPAPAATGLKASLVFALVAMTLLDRFGLKLSEAYSVGAALFAFYGIVAAMLLTRSARINRFGASMVVAVATIAGLSFLANASFGIHQYVSLGSLLLLLVLYAPFMLSLSPAVGTPALWRWLMNWYVNFALVCAVAGIVQFYAQFVFHAPWLFDFTSYIPAALRGSGGYNTTNPVGALIKSNGFFLREASGFSWYSALALVCEWSLRRRKLPMVLLALAIVVSYSGSGLLALGVALLFPLGMRTLLRVLGCVAVGAVVVVLFGDALNLSYTLGRVGEFDAGATTSSAYCRFIAPGKLVAEQIDSDAWTTLLGHGSGTTQKMSTVCETTYGKLLFEYGLLGAIVFSTLIFAAINRSAAPIRVRVILVVQWFLLGGNLLAPESLMLIYFMSGMWPPGVAEDGAPRAPDVQTTPAATRGTRRLEST